MSAFTAWIQSNGASAAYEDQTGRQVGGPFSAFDLLGRKQPRRLGTPDYLLLVARIDPARVRRLPASAIDEEGVDEEGEFALIECPCEHRPVARRSLRKCAGCERYYVLVEAGVVYVTYGAMRPPALIPANRS